MLDSTLGEMLVDQLQTLSPEINLFDCTEETKYYLIKTSNYLLFITN